MANKGTRRETETGGPEPDAVATIRGEQR